MPPGMIMTRDTPAAAMRDMAAVDPTRARTQPGLRARRPAAPAAARRRRQGLSPRGQRHPLAHPLEPGGLRLTRSTTRCQALGSS